MGTPVDFKGRNCTLKAAPGSENVGDLPVFRNGVCSVSCWRLSADELAEINRTGVAFLAVFFGNTQPPVCLGSETEVRAVTADYGVWKR